jgi:ATP-dependent protease ClpP protease subunit
MSHERFALQIQHDFNRDKYFSPEEAKEYGIVDTILKPSRVLMS